MVGTKDSNDLAVSTVKNIVLQGVTSGYISPNAELQVQRALDLLRAEARGSELTARIEAISCTLRKMHHLLIDRRVNAYASALLRLRRVADAL